MTSFGFDPGAKRFWILLYFLIMRSDWYLGFGGFLRYESLMSPFVYSLPTLPSAACMTASLAETELMRIVSGFQLSAFACSIAFTVGTGVVKSTHVSAPESFCFAICDA